MSLHYKPQHCSVCIHFCIVLEDLNDAFGLQLSQKDNLFDKYLLVYTPISSFRVTCARLDSDSSESEREEVFVSSRDFIHKQVEIKYSIFIRALVPSSQLFLPIFVFCSLTHRGYNSIE